jgi:hypothetical protein
VKAMTVAPAMTRRLDQVVLDVMYVCRKMTTMYYCVKTMDGR